MRTKQRYLIDVVNRKGLLTYQNVQREIVKMCQDGTVRTVVLEGNAQQKAQGRNLEFQKELRNLGVREFEIYQTLTGAGARSEQSNFDVTIIGGYFDMGMVTLPYGGPQDERDKVDAYIDQLTKWHTDENGHSVKGLVRDMVMATLFAESAAFELARRDDKPQRAPKITLPSGRGLMKAGWDWTQASEGRNPENSRSALAENNERVRLYGERTRRRRAS
jgi:hypothetical protein